MPETVRFVYAGETVISLFGQVYSSMPARLPLFLRYGPMPLTPRS